MIALRADKDGVRLLKFLSSHTEIPYSVLQKLLRAKDVRVDGVKVDKDVLLRCGSEIIVYYNAEIAPIILYQDENIAVTFKPKGIASVGEKSYAERVTAVIPNAICAHRLDTNTDGILLFAKSQAVFDLLVQAFSAGDIEKEYTVVVYGIPEKNTEKVTLPLFKDADKGIVRVASGAGSVDSVTEYTVTAVNQQQNLALLNVRLHTGRTHQIRCVMAYLGYPVLGDGKYGNNQINRSFGVKKQQLTATRLVINADGVLSYLHGKAFTVPFKSPLNSYFDN